MSEQSIEETDVIIIGEEIRSNPNNILVSKGKVKSEKEIVSSEKDNSLNNKTNKNNETPQNTSRVTTETREPTSTSNEVVPRRSTSINYDQSAAQTEYTKNTLLDIENMINNKKISLNTNSLRSIGSVDMHEFLKSTPSENFHRKGFYSCAGCSSVFTSSDLYNYHIRRNLGDFSYYCEQCQTNLEATNHCMINMHYLTAHNINNNNSNNTSSSTISSGNSAGANSNVSEILVRSNISYKETLSDSNTEFVDDNGCEISFTDLAHGNIKKIIENHCGNFNIDLFNPYMKLNRDQRYYLLPMARKEVIQIHKFYSDHFRANKLMLSDKPVELLHCFMCDFVCPNQAQLISHLQGDWPNSVTKCGFCNLVLPLDKKNQCAAKAHVLLHLGVYIMCPRCGFVPPPDLTPYDYEITLRLHLRFVCFHFNCIQIYVCPVCTSSSASSRAYNTSIQVIQHIYEEHLADMRNCHLCVSGSTGEADNPIVRTIEPTQKDQLYSIPELRQHLIAVHARLDYENVLPNCAIKAKSCEYCSETITQKEMYYQHIVLKHKSNLMKGKSAFRCFGTCKRIHQTIEDFQHHRSDCLQCINVKNKLYQPKLANTNPESVSLCFCLYCGIGSRKIKSDKDETEMQSEPLMFPDLNSTHEHEKNHTGSVMSNTACPWCNYKFSSKMDSMTKHMETHFAENWFLAWYSDRNKNFKNNPDDMLYCYCQGAIDNPLSLHCHSIPQNLTANSYAMTPLNPLSSMPPTNTTQTNSNNASCNTIKHVVLSDTIYREFITSARHRIAGYCQLCYLMDSQKNNAPTNSSTDPSNTTTTSTNTAPSNNDTTNSNDKSTGDNLTSNSANTNSNNIPPVTIYSNTIELSWHIFIKHRNQLCYVCKQFRIINSENTSLSRVVMWHHIYHCIRRHTFRFNIKSGLFLLENIANCETTLDNCTILDMSKNTSIPTSLLEKDAENNSLTRVLENELSDLQMPVKIKSISSTEVDSRSLPTLTTVSIVNSNSSKQNLRINVDAIDPAENCASSGETDTATTTTVVNGDSLTNVSNCIGGGAGAGAVINGYRSSTPTILSSSLATTTISPVITTATTTPTTIPMETDQSSNTPPSNPLNYTKYECLYCKENVENCAKRLPKTSFNKNKLPPPSSGAAASIYNSSDQFQFESEESFQTHLKQCHCVDFNPESVTRSVQHQSAYNNGLHNSTSNQDTAVVTVITNTKQSPNYLCFLCGLKFDSREMWEDHTLAMHARGFRKLGLDILNPNNIVLDNEKITYRCYLCNQRFEKKSTCENHMINLHSVMQNEINWGMLTDSADSIRRHKSSLNSSNLCLTTCPSKRLKLDSKPAPHSTPTNSSQDDPYVCALCPFECCTRSQMVNHARQLHSSKPMHHDPSSIPLSSSQSLSEPYWFICPDCCLSFRTPQSRKIHMAFTHRIVTQVAMQSAEKYMF